MTEVLTQWYVVAFFVATIPANLSPIIYWLVTGGDWHKTADGWHVMCYMAVLAAVLDLTLVFGVVQNDPTWLLWMGPVAWFALAGVIIWRLMLILEGWHFPRGKKSTRTQEEKCADQH